MATEKQRQEWVQAELAPGEKIIWVGFPDPRAFMGNYPLRAVDVGAAYGSLIIWIAYLIVSAFRVRSPESWVGLTLLSSVFFVAAVTYCIGRHWLVAYNQAERIAYALTNRRGLIIQDMGKNADRKVRTLSAEDLSRIVWRERINVAGVNGVGPDSHDLVCPHLLSDNGDEIGFLAVHNSRLVEQTIRSQLLSARV
jgi:hypothetical protein